MLRHSLLEDQIKEHLPEGSKTNPALQKFLNAVNATYTAFHEAHHSGTSINSEAIEALRRSEEKYRNILERSTDVIYKTNQFGFFTYVNPVMERTTGYTKEELYRKHFSELIRDDYRKMASDIYKEQINLKKASSYFEFPILTKEGRETWIGQSVQYSELNDREFEFTALAIDITDRKVAEKTIAVNEEKYRNIIANIHLGLVEVDRNEVIRYCNQAFCELTGYSKAELIGQNILDMLIFEESRPELKNKTEQRLKGVSDIYEIQIRNKKGEIRWWMVSGAPNYDDAGNLIGSIGIHLDVTERKLLEQELKLSKQKAEESSKTKEAFLANMSHEIRTPLNAIIGMIRELSYEKLTTKQRVYVANTSAAAQHLLSVLNNILDISKIEAGEVNMESQPFQLESIIKDVVLMMKTSAAEKNIYLKAHFSPDIKKALIGDATRIRQIILNLVGNAVKFTHSGGISINCELEEEIAGEQRILISVNDTGIGMEEKYLKNIFTKFSQEDISTARNYGGTGLGMAITRELIKLMNGNIDVKSKKNEGTQVELKITLPIGPEFAAKSADTTRKTNPNIRVLLVEDNEFNRLVATKTLERNNCKVSSAANGKDAVEQLQGENSFDVILMDLQMPVMDGLEATKIIRNELNISTPIIALSANAFKTESDVCLAIGMNDYVTKPFEEKVLMNCIFKHVHSQETILSTQEITDFPKKLYSMTNLRALSGGDKKYLEKLIDVYVRQTNQSLIQLKEAVKAKDLKSVFEISHQMKSGIDSFNIESLKTEIREIEKDAKQGVYSERMEKLISYSENVLKKVMRDIQAEFNVDEEGFRPLYEYQP